MKKIAVCLLCFLMLCGCGDTSQTDSALSLREKVLKSNGCTFDCRIVADYSEKLFTFAMSCSFDSSGNMSFTVSEPESISGITGRIDQEGGKLTFDEQALVFSMLADGYITPVSAPWVFMKSLRGGYINACGKEENGYRITIHDSYEENALQLDIWTDLNNTPVHGEILWLGRRILSIDVSNFSCL